MSITTELGRGVTYHDGVSQIKPHGNVTVWSWQIKQNTKNICPLPQCLCQSLTGGDKPWGAPTYVTWPFDHVVLRDNVTNIKPISTTTILMATKLGAMVTYLESHGLARSHEKTKTNICALPQCPWLPNLAGWENTRTSFLQGSHKALWSSGLTRSHEKLNLSYLYSHMVNGHQNWQGGDLLREPSTHKVKKVRSSNKLKN